MSINQTKSEENIKYINKDLDKNLSSSSVEIFIYDLNSLVSVKQFIGKF